MKHAHYADIDALLVRVSDLITQVEENEPGFETAAADFVVDDAEKLSVLLRELAYLRDRAGGREEKKQKAPPAKRRGISQRFLAEGTSGTSAEKALARALSNAAHFFSEHDDVILTLSELGQLPNGIYRAVVEVHVTKAGRDKEGGTDTRKLNPLVNTELASTAHQRANRQQEARRAQMVFNQFLHLKSGLPGNLPPSLLVNITDPRLLNHLIAQQFFQSTHPNAEPPPGGSATLLVHTRDPNEPEPKG